MAEKTEKKYVITNHRSGKVLASCGGSAVQMTANGGETQVWCAVPAEGTSVQLVHKVSGLALTFRVRQKTAPHLFSQRHRATLPSSGS